MLRRGAGAGGARLPVLRPLRGVRQPVRASGRCRAQAGSPSRHVAPSRHAHERGRPAPPPGRADHAGQRAGGLARGARRRPGPGRGLARGRGGRPRRGRVRYARRCRPGPHRRHAVGGQRGAAAVLRGGPGAGRRPGAPYGAGHAGAAPGPGRHRRRRAHAGPVGQRRAAERRADRARAGGGLGRHPRRYGARPVRNGPSRTGPRGGRGDAGRAARRAQRGGLYGPRAGRSGHRAGARPGPVRGRLGGGRDRPAVRAVGAPGRAGRRAGPAGAGRRRYFQPGHARPGCLCVAYRGDRAPGRPAVPAGLGPGLARWRGGDAQGRAGGRAGRVRRRRARRGLAPAARFQALRTGLPRASAEASSGRDCA